MSDATSGGRARDLSRRAFLQASTMAAAGGALAGSLDISSHAHAAGNDLIKIALVGCGGRGTGAAIQALSTSANVKLVAITASSAR